MSQEKPKAEEKKPRCRFASSTGLTHCADEFARENDCSGCEELDQIG